MIEPCQKIDTVIDEIASKKRELYLASSLARGWIVRLQISSELPLWHVLGRTEACSNHTALKNWILEDESRSDDVDGYAEFRGLLEGYFHQD